MPSLAPADSITLKQAFAIAMRECEHPTRFTPQEREDWNAAEKVLLERNYCPHCACGGERTKLGARQPGNWNFNAGRECPNCEEFIACGEQPEFQDQATEWRGDADCGL